MADKLRAQQQIEHLQNKFLGTGHAETTKFEWTSNIMRDSYASYIAHEPLLAYMSLGMGECEERVRIQMLEKMIAPVGPMPPEDIEGGDDSSENAMDADSSNGEEQIGNQPKGGKQNNNQPNGDKQNSKK